MCDEGSSLRPPRRLAAAPTTTSLLWSKAQPPTFHVSLSTALDGACHHARSHPQMQLTKGQRKLEALQHRQVNPAHHDRKSTPPERPEQRSGSGSGASRVRGRPTSCPIELSTIDQIFESTLTEERLCKAAGTSQLQDVRKLEIVVDTSETSIEGVWTSVPSLHMLVLDGSSLRSFRDLGLGLRRLHTFSLRGSCVTDLDGIGGALSGLRELRLADNQISDVTPLACHGQLQVLDLARNQVNDLKALEILSTLSSLYSLDLRQNPLTEALSRLPGATGLGVVNRLIPQLRVLDNAQLSDEKDMAISGTIEEANTIMCQGLSNARTAWTEDGRPSGVTRRGDRQASQKYPCRGTSETLTDSTPSGREILQWDSDLTQGGAQVLAGNPSAAIRRHKSRAEPGGRGRESSPQRVLATLDLARQMEREFRQRHTQIEDTVSEWRRETYWDSMPQEEMSLSDTVADESASVMLRPRDSKRVPLGGMNRCHSGATLTHGPPGKGNAPREFHTSGILTSFLVNEVDESEQSGNVGRVQHMSGRPWTTGEMVTSLAADKGQEIGEPRGPADREGETAVKEPREHRPRDARQPARCFPAGGILNTSWRSMWESLQSTGSLPSNSTGITGRNADESSKGCGDNTTTRGVDVRGQRRARTVMSQLRGCSSEDDEGVQPDGGSYADGSSCNSSDEADGRAEIKRRASTFTTVHAVTPRRLHAGKAGRASCTAGVGLGFGQQRRRTSFSEGNSSLIPETTWSKQTFHAAYRRSFATMDENSSCEEGDYASPTAKRAKSGVGANEEGTRGRGIPTPEGSSPRCTSSIHASRRLGFDLKKSLAAIDDWTHQTKISEGIVTPREKSTGRMSSFIVKTSAKSPTKNQATDEGKCRFEDGSAGKGGADGNSVAGLITGSDGALSESDDDSDGEAVLSVEAARAALGISRASAPLPAAMTPTPAHTLPVEIRASNVSDRVSAPKGERGARKKFISGARQLSMPSVVLGQAVSMSDEMLESMLRRQPRTVPELRTKDSFREFFRGMDSARMGRLLRRAYKGSFPVEEVERKVEKRLGLVGDVLVW